MEVAAAAVAVVAWLMQVGAQERDVVGNLSADWAAAAAAAAAVAEGFSAAAEAAGARDPSQ